MSGQRRVAPLLRMVGCVWGTARVDTPAARPTPMLGTLRRVPVHAGQIQRRMQHLPPLGAKAGAQTRQNVDGFQAFRFVPSPRAIFSVMTMFGAFGYALVAGLQLAPLPAGLLALIPACGIEYFAVRPLWNLMFQLPGAAVQFPGNAAFLRGQGGYALSQRPRPGSGGT